MIIYSKSTFAYERIVVINIFKIIKVLFSNLQINRAYAFIYIIHSFSYALSIIRFIYEVDINRNVII
jgi:hypothetical protein